MRESTFQNCKSSHCSEKAITFSDFCWAHTNHSDYLEKLNKNLSSLAGKETSLNFKKVIADKLDFSHLNIKNSIFSQACLTSCHFIGTILDDSDFIGAKLIHSEFVATHAVGVNFTRAFFEHTSLTYSDLRNACFVEAYFKETDFMGAILYNSVLWNVELQSARHINKRNFKNPDESLKNSKASINEKSVYQAFESYRLLKHYFYRSGLKEDGSWAALNELKMQRKHFFATADIRYIPSLLMNIFSGYTEKPSRVTLSSLAIIFIFGLIYYWCGAVEPLNSLDRNITLWDSIYFSFITFTTVGYGDFIPKSAVAFRLLVCVEAFSGPFMAGLYVFTLTRRYAAS